MTKEEDEIFQKIVDLKKERDVLFVIFEELEDLIKSGYNCESCKGKLENLLYSYDEYNKWKTGDSNGKITK